MSRTAEPIEEKVMRAFPKIYFFLPRPRAAVAGQDSKPVTLGEAACTLLWLLETAMKESGNSSVLQGEVMGVMERLFPQDRFSKTVTTLWKAGCILTDFEREDRRRKRLSLTPVGEQVLTEIKSERRALVSVLLEGISKKHQAQAVDVVERLAGVAWSKMSPSK